MSDDVNVLALVKGGERYIFLYQDEKRAEVLRTLGRYAASPDLNFSWYDAAILSQKVRRQQHRKASSKSTRFRMTPSTDHIGPDS